jgi:acylphosphatase
MDVLEKQVRLTALVKGKVQGVGYRRFAQRQAEIMRLSGYAENLSDGGVEIIAEGSKSDLEHLLHFLRRGSTHAEVGEIEVQWAEATGLEGFFVY